MTLSKEEDSRGTEYEWRESETDASDGDGWIESTQRQTHNEGALTKPQTKEKFKGPHCTYTHEKSVTKSLT